MRKCTKCGELNSDWIEVCGNCGNPLGASADVKKGADSEVKMRWPGYSHTDLGTSAELEEHPLEDSLLSVALNVRRIFILFLYLVFAIVATQLFGLWLQASRPSVGNAQAAAIVLGLVLAAVGIVLIFTAVYRKRLSQL